MPYRAAVLAVATCLAMLVSAAPHAAGCDEECDDVSAWSAYTSIDLEARYAPDPAIAHWHLEFDPNNNDTRVDSEIVSGSTRERGTIGVIGGRIMVSKGLDLNPGYEIDALDGPVLTMRLLLAVLNRTIAGGPDKLAGEKAIDHRESKVGIRFATPSAEGHIKAPWQAHGIARKLPGGAISYEIELQGGSQDPLGRAGPAMDIRFKGILDHRKAPVFDDAMSLHDWKVYGVGPQSSTRGDAQILDYGARPRSDAGVRTVADARALASRGGK